MPRAVPTRRLRRAERALGRPAQLALRGLRDLALRQRREGRRRGQVGHAAEQDLEVPKRRGGLELRDHVAGHLDADVRQAPLLVRDAHHARPGPGVDADVVVVGDEKGAGGPLLEPELPTPRHVLDREQRAVGDQDHVEGAVADDDVLRPVDDPRDHRQSRALGRVGAVDEHVAVRAGQPARAGRGVESLLHVCAVKVEGCSVRLVNKRCGDWDVKVSI